MGQWVGPGIGDVGSYQVSGTPFVFDCGAGVTTTATLNYVTSEVQINTTGAGCQVHFGDAGATLYTLPTGLSTFRIRCKKIAVTVPAATTASVCASLTAIESKHLEVHDQATLGSL